jgi:hypothetical protein
VPSWENSSLAIPPNTAGCDANGALLVSVGFGPRVVRYNLDCIDSTSGPCANVGDVSYGTNAWPLLNVPNFADAPTASNDQYMVRFKTGRILMVHQGVRTNSSPNAACTSPCPRGVEYMFTSDDCGATWTYRSILDSMTDGPTSEPGRYKVGGGHDRPEVYADPFNDGRVYVAVTGSRPSQPWRIPLFRSNDQGNIWTHVGEVPDIEPAPAYLTGMSNGRIYIMGRTGSNWDIYSYDPTTGAFSSRYRVATNGTRLPGVHMSVAGGEGIMRIGSYSDGDRLRVFYNVKNSNNDYDLKVVRVLISGSTITIEDTQTISAGAGRSITGATKVETDRLEWNENQQVNPAMIYWYDVATTPTSGTNRGPARVKYAYFYDSVSSSSSDCMSKNTTGCRDWTTFTAGAADSLRYGHYQKGAFWRTNAGALKFLALWGEQPNLAGDETRTNVLTLTP